MAMKIGIMVDSLRLPLRDGIKKAAQMGAQGIQIYAVAHEFCPEVLGAADRAEIKALIEGCGLSISALCGDLGGHGFAVASDNPHKIERSKRIVDLAKDMGADIITTHIGVVPEDSTTERYKTMQQACYELGRYAEEMGARFAIETGPESPEVLCDFLDSLGCGGIGVNYDPANLVMVTDCDPVAGVYTLRRYIFHTHAKDGIMKKKTDPEVIYNFFAEGGIEDLRMEDYFLETPLGEGGVDLPAWVSALSDIGFDGFLTIEREVGHNPAGDIEAAIQTLNRILKR